MMPGVQKPHWLAPVAQKASAQASLRAGIQARERRDPATRHTPCRCDAGHAGGSVHQHRARTALPLRAATVLHLTDAEVLTQQREQREVAGGRADGAPVDSEGDVVAGGRRHGGQLKDCPQPQVRWALGLSIEKPAFCRLSL